MDELETQIRAQALTAAIALRPNRAQERATAERLDYDRRWATEFGSEDALDKALSACERQVERIGYDPLQGEHE